MSATTQRAHHHTCRLLIADADADARQLYREALRPMACDFIDASDGRDALVSALAHPPSLLITDTRLPVFGGIALLDVLRRDVITREVPVLVVTADSREPELQRVRDAGADGVLIKPVSPDALLREARRLLEETLERHQASPQTASPQRRQKAHSTIATTSPPASPPHLRCPMCDVPLAYEHSHVGGVRGHREQWDTFRCSACGAYEYRHRTRKIRKLTQE